LDSQARAREKALDERDRERRHLLHGVVTGVGERRDDEVVAKRPEGARDCVAAHGWRILFASDREHRNGDAPGRVGQAVARAMLPRHVTVSAMSSGQVEAARAGDAVALEELLRERRTQVVRYAMRLCLSPEDAQDATQEVLLALARYVKALREVAALSTWLFLAVRTHCTRLARRSLRHALSLDDGAPLAIEGASPEEQLVDRQLRERLSVVLSEIEPGLRDALLRRDVLGETAVDAARALGISVDALKSRLHRARREVKRRLLASLREPAGRKIDAATISRTLGPG
jgi:RNA polymerase sigma factor (sigma-70 family)